MHLETALTLQRLIANPKKLVVEYSYMQGAEPNEGENYYFVSYNDIAGKPSTEEVTQ